MGDIVFTARQREAIETVDRSVVVTAAAGSGKTAVLAERCAHLVCDLPPDRRCGVDELLVVTFTEAAAAEMKARILQAIRGRLRSRPRDGYLRTQAALIDTAQISTLHSFCLWLLRRWFSEADIDPAAAVMQEEEARLLRQDTLKAMFDGLYEADTPLGRGFVRLVEEYGLGQDKAIAAVVLDLADFLRSLPDPQGWLARAGERVGPKADETIAEFYKELGDEIGRQQLHVEKMASFVEQRVPGGAFHGGKLREYADALAAWSKRSDFEAVRSEIVEFEMLAHGAPRKRKNEPAEETAGREMAREIFKTVREQLLQRQLQRLARFGAAEAIEGLAAVAPHVDTLCGLATEFARRYQRAKRAQDALDFADLERGAYELLCDRGDLPRGPTGLPGPSPIARELQDRFAYVLVDEFQDINPLQDAILRLVSRESDPSRRDNLFVVGDVKQSIYRFRLAEPELFQGRIEQALDALRCQGQAERAAVCTPAGGASGPVCVRLQENFRSSKSLIAGINLLFERLMTWEVGGVDYDESARLRPPPHAADDPSPQPIELHILERRVQPFSDDGGEDDDAGPERERRVDPDDPTLWETIEREAHLIGTRMRELHDAGMGWGDMAVLLRAAAHAAQPLADVLGRMGIPTYAEAGDALLEATEVRDILALLHVLDNPQQDIPLASVLRSGVTGMAFSEDELVAIRGLDREVPFHEAVRRYARPVEQTGRQGDDADLAGRVALLMERLGRWRREARRRPVADVLWTIYGESGYLAYVGGLPQGRFRRANLLALHERARQFGGFRRQGLHRFLRFVESLEDAGQSLRGAPPLGKGQDAVRVMSIHRSKGLEFPVVFVADLGKRFNFEDARRRIIFDRRVGIGMRVVDPQRLIEYPSVQHLRVARSLESGTRSEELRVLYVALTRAKQRLILVGSTGLSWVEQTRALWSGLGQDVSPASGQAAGTPLEWIVQALASVGGPGSAGSPSVAWSDGTTSLGGGGMGPLQADPCQDAGDTDEHGSAFGGPMPPGRPMQPMQARAHRPDAVGAPLGGVGRDGGGERLLYHVTLHSEDAMRGWQVESSRRTARNRALVAAARLEPLPENEPRYAADFNASALLDRLDYPYPHLASSSIRAVVGASEAKRALDPFADEHQPAGQPHYRPTFDAPRVLAEDTLPVLPAGRHGDGPDIRITPQQRGTLTHRVLERLDFTRPIEGELQRLVGAALITAEEAGAIDVAALHWFVGTPLGQRIGRAGAVGYRREVTFISAEPAWLFDPALEGVCDDTVLVRGIVDGVLIGDAGPAGKAGLEIIDFKTDAVDAAGAEERAEQYAMQMRLYARAVGRIWRRPVARGWLVFLTPRRIIEAAIEQEVS